MLVVHSSSRCDVCLSEYSWEAHGKRPHAIACGHIFCRDCLYTNTPPLCPLCRHTYQPNKMKKLHVDKPEDIDDHKEIDLLQRLVISWETPPEQLGEVIEEVDSWLARRSDEACVALRKARLALARSFQLKKSERDLSGKVRHLEGELEQWNTRMDHLQRTSAAERDDHLAQIESMRKEIFDLRSFIERLQPQPQYYKNSSRKNPLPAPPRPLETPNLPSFEQALSESGPGMRITELPSSPMSSYPRFEVETHKKSKRKWHSTEQPYYDDPRYQQGSSSQTRQAAPSHYVQAHINVPELSPPPHSSRSLHQLPEDPETNPSLDVYTITEAYLQEYSTGYQNGHHAANGGRRKEPSRRAHVNGHVNGHHLSQPTSAYDSTEDYPPRIADVYPNYPHSAPATNERSPRHTHQRRGIAQSSILSSSSSPAPDESSGSTSRSRPRSGTAGPGTHDIVVTEQELEFANARLGSMLLGSDAAPEPAPAPMIRPPSVVASPLPAPPAALEVQPANTRARSPSGQSANSRRTVSSWGTGAPSHLTEGSLIAGLSFFRPDFRPEVRFDGIEGGQEYQYRALNSDGESIRTRQMSISSVGYEESSSGHVSRSPPRPIESMVGVMPNSPLRHINLGVFQHANSDGQLAQHSTGWNGNVPPTHGARSSTHGHQIRGSMNSRSTSQLDRLVRSNNDDRARHRSSDSFSSPATRPLSWVDWSGPRDANGYVPNGNSLRHSTTEGQSPAQSDRDRDRRSATRTSSDDNVLRRGQRRPWPSIQSLPESPSDHVAAGTYDHGDPYGAQQNGHGAHPMVIGHAEPDAAPPSSFMGNALGLELSLGPTASINAPTPMLPSTFLRSWSEER